MAAPGNTRHLVWSVVPLTVLAVAAHRLPAQTARSGSAVPDTMALARDLPRMLRTSGVPGLSMAIVKDGQVTWARAFGTVNDSALTPLDTGTVFEAASLSKPVFAYIVLRLVDRGELDLDRPLFELLAYPRLADDERYKRITARMVLSHSSGLPNWGGERLTLLFDPGTEYSYSGEGFVLLQKVVERVTGRSLDDLARQEVFEPLGMTSSGYVWHDRFAGHEAWAKDWLWRVAPVNRYVQANAAATLLTTAPDYARFVAAVLTGRGLSATAWKLYLTPVRETSPGIGIGLGIRVEANSAGPIFYHSGNNGRRFTSYMTGDVARRVGFVYFTGASNGTSLVAALATRVFGTDRPARNWATFDRYDDPHLLALQSVRRAAVEHGESAARARLGRIASSSVTRPSLDERLDLAAFLSGRRLFPLSLELLKRAVAEAPDSASVHLALGHALESAANLDGAIASYRHAEALDSASDEAQASIRWVEARKAMRDRHVTIAARLLESYAGLYEDRTVTLREGRLYYGGGAAPESAVTPMDSTLFEVDADPSVRIRFVADSLGPAERLIATYSDGTIDEWKRSR